VFVPDPEAVQRYRGQLSAWPGHLQLAVLTMAEPMVHWVVQLYCAGEDVGPALADVLAVLQAMRELQAEQHAGLAPAPAQAASGEAVGT